MVEVVVEPVLRHRRKPWCIGFCFGFQLSAAEAKLAAAENKLSNIGTAEGGESCTVLHPLGHNCILLSVGVRGAVQSDGPSLSSFVAHAACKASESKNVRIRIICMFQSASDASSFCLFECSLAVSVNINAFAIVGVFLQVFLLMRRLKTWEMRWHSWNNTWKVSSGLAFVLFVNVRFGFAWATSLAGCLKQKQKVKQSYFSFWFYFEKGSYGICSTLWYTHAHMLAYTHTHITHTYSTHTHNTHFIYSFILHTFDLNSTWTCVERLITSLWFD